MKIRQSPKEQDLHLVTFEPYRYKTMGDRVHTVTGMNEGRAANAALYDMSVGTLTATDDLDRLGFSQVANLAFRLADSLYHDPETKDLRLDDQVLEFEMGELDLMKSACSLYVSNTPEALSQLRSQGPLVHGGFLHERMILGTLAGHVVGSVEGYQAAQQQ